MEFANVFLKKYKAFDRFKGIRQALVSLGVGAILITTGALLGSGIAPVLILSGFASVFLGFIFFFVAALRTGQLENAFYEILRTDLWTPIIGMTSPLKDVTLNEETPPLDDEFLYKYVAQKGSLDRVYYTLKSGQVSLSALSISHTVSTGKGASQHIDFRGYYLSVPTSLTETVRAKNDRTPNWMKPIKNKIKTDTDGSEAYHIEGKPSFDVESFMNQWHDHGFKHVAWDVSDGISKLAVFESKVIPKIHRQPGQLVSTHQDHLMRLKKVMDTFSTAIQSIEEYY